MSFLTDTITEQKDGTKIDIWFFLKLLVGIVLLVKAGDGLFPIFEKASYGPEAQDLFRTLETFPSVNIAITIFHFLLGGFILWNILAPMATAAALPVFILATVFEFLYGTAIFPQLLAIAGLISCVALLYHYKGHYTDIFDRA
ncbi:MAG: hypothetical protein VXV96_05365 [Bdellovibrionota bacterium]|nr:hypothetical protein [Bdellovibrionota bacterium]